MKYIFSGCMFVSFVLASYFAIKFFWSRERKYIENRLLAVFCFSSAVWSLGFSALMVQTDPDMAYLCRSFGMIGVFLYLITAQMLVCHISGIRKMARNIINGIAYTGVIVYFLVIQKSQVVYRLDSMGMTYFFKPGFCNNVYTGYSVLVALNILGVSIYMIRCSKLKRIRVFGKKFLLVETLILVGMTLDTIFPLLGIAAIPGSSLTQFWGMVVLYNAVYAVNRSRINITNMSEFIYYSMAMPVLVYDSDRKIQIMNDAAVAFLQTGREELKSQDISINQLFDVEEDTLFSFEDKRKDVDALCRKNDVYCSLAVSKINDTYGDIIGYILIVTDLSERMKTVQSLEEAMEDAKEANQAKSTFLANMSHEIRTPMNSIIGFSELLLQMDIDSQVREYVEDIKGSSYNLLAIINDILDLSKIESGKMELVCVEYYMASLMNDIYLLISNQAKDKGLEFHMNIDPKIPNGLFGDKIRIRGVLTNLLNNAVKYTQEGSVSLEVGIALWQGDEITLKFKVSDTGMGIKPEEQSHLFESFSQVDKKMHYGVEGSGLGLAIAKGYVTLMGGDIFVESLYGKGSVFTAVIPQRITDASPLDQSYAKRDDGADEFSMGKLRVQDARVLLVDDNPINLKVAQNTLRHYGMDVDLAESGWKAIALCQENRYQLVFMDQMMPEMDGVEAMRQIRQNSPYYDFGGTCKIIVLTANAISGAREELMEAGFDEYLEKPMNFNRLEQLLIQFLPKECIRIAQDMPEEQPQTKEDDEIIPLEKILSGVDVRQGIQNCGGKLEEYLSVLQMTYRSGEEQLEKLKILAGEQEYKGYTIQIHALKGIALGLGTGDVAELAKQLEQAGKAGKQQYIRQHTEEFCQRYIQLLGQIERVLEEYQMLEDIQKKERKKDLEREDILQSLEEIKQCMESFDFAQATERLRDVMKCEMAQEYRQVLTQISRCVEEIDIQAMEEWMKKI